MALFGATGFTGGLTARYLGANGPDGLRWALVGRNRGKLEAVLSSLDGVRRSGVSAPDLLVADAADAAALAKVAESAKVVITTVGPYALYGEPLVAACAAAGIDANRIILDPGFGFAKTLAHNLSLFKHMEALYRLGRPLLVGVSRKSMIGLTLDRPVGERLYGSLALAALAMTKGASILRVHDVAETVDVVRMIAAVQNAE